MTKRFLPATNVRWAKILAHQPPFIRRKKSKGRFAVGVRYETKAQEALELAALGLRGLQYLRSPWIEFQDDNGRRWCQADAILLNHDQRALIIYEIKYRHCAEAWWQLTHLYEPVVKALFPAYPVVCRMEVVHWFDPAVEFPEAFDRTESPLLIPKRNRVAVCIFNPGRRNQGGFSGAGQSYSPGSNQTPGSNGAEESSPESINPPSTRPDGLVRQGSCEVPAGAEGSTSIAVQTKGD